MTARERAGGVARGRPHVRGGRTAGPRSVNGHGRDSRARRSPQHRLDHRALSAVRRRGRRRRRPLDRRHRTARRGGGRARRARPRPWQGRRDPGGRATPSARRSRCSSTPTGRTRPRTSRWSSRPILRGEADHVSASRLMGGSSELHGGFDEFLRLTGSSFITACINWRFRVRLSESQNGFRAIRTDVLQQLPLIEDLTTIEQEMIIRTLRAGSADGGSAEPRVPARARRLAHHGLAGGTALCVFPRAPPVLLNPRSRSAGEHPRNLGRTRRGGRPPGRRPHCRRHQRGTADTAQARDPLPRPVDRGLPGVRRPRAARRATSSRPPRRTRRRRSAGGCRRRRSATTRYAAERPSPARCRGSAEP